nr:hypothetical protein BaRGS_006677 [Batillaria attramentaria]
MSTPRIPVVGNIVGHRKTAAALTTPTTTISNSISTTPASKDVVDTEGPDHQHSEFFQGNVDVPKERCDDFRRCTDPLYSNVNIHRVQAGDNLGLANICGLLYKNGGGRYATLGDAECRESERGAIRRDIDSSLTKTLETPSQDNADSWNKLKHCLAGQDGDKGRYVSKVCSEAFHLDRLKTASTNGTKAGFLCDDAKVDRVAETFFNRKLEQLHCACANTTSATSGTSSTTIQPPHSGVSGTLQSTDTVCPQNVSLKIGLGFGFGFLVVLTFVVVVLFRRQRTLKRRLRQEQMRVSHLLSATDDTAGFYSEIDDFTQLQWCSFQVMGQHGDYIQNNLEFLKKKCEDFQKCTDALYSAENFHRVLAGEDLELSNICGLLHKNDGGRYGTVSDECRESEREAIRRDIDSSLTKALVNLPRDHTQNRWRDLGNCVGRNRSPGNKETPVNKVCS